MEFLKDNYAVHAIVHHDIGGLPAEKKFTLAENPDRFMFKFTDVQIHLMESSYDSR